MDDDDEPVRSDERLCAPERVGDEWDDYGRMVGTSGRELD